MYTALTWQQTYAHHIYSLQVIDSITANQIRSAYPSNDDHFQFSFSTIHLTLMQEQRFY
jgi:hypothetical protein